MTMFRSEEPEEIFRFNGYLVQYNSETNCIDLKFPDGEIEGYPIDELAASGEDYLTRKAAFLRVTGQLLCMILGLNPEYLEGGVQVASAFQTMLDYTAKQDGVELPEVEEPVSVIRRKKEDFN